MKKSFQQIASFYRKRFGFEGPILAEPPLADTTLMIVIPVYDEPALLNTLESLQECDPSRGRVEVILVINSSKSDQEEVKARNLQTLKIAKKWTTSPNGRLTFHFIHRPDLTPKHAGVGLARKIGMDEALYRFAAIDNPGAIVCLDADCTVAPNYLRVLDETFYDPNTKACSIHFEHAFERELDPSLREGIVHYELFLRYYIQALRYSGFPFASHTIGSSMAVRADVYALQGGMNRRKAGEDFYFLHKLMPLGGFEDVNETTVYPSSRISPRVPFGTGRAQLQWQVGKAFKTYHPLIFEELKKFLQARESFWQMQITEIEQALLSLSPQLQEFLLQQNFSSQLLQMKQNSTSAKSLEMRFFSWFDGFCVLKLVHWLRDHFYGEVNVKIAAKDLLIMMGLNPAHEIKRLLLEYRRLDKSGS